MAAKVVRKMSENVWNSVQRYAGGKNGKCNNLQQNESIWEERIELITHIFLSSQVNLAWTKVKTQQSTEEYGIELILINSLK